MLLKLNQRHWPRLFLWLKVWYSIWMVFYHIESTLLIELTFQRRKSEGGCSEFLDRLLSVGLLEEEKNSSILWLLKHSYWSKVSLAVQNSSIGDLVTHSLTHSQYFYFWHTKNDPRRHCGLIIHEYSWIGRRQCYLTLSLKIRNAVLQKLYRLTWILMCRHF